tara:strand:- start:2763 stop:2915 length:153 start_codon:yes stop_codon:yes gene_type:complete
MELIFAVDALYELNPIEKMIDSTLILAFGLIACVNGVMGKIPMCSISSEI